MNSAASQAGKDRLPNFQPAQVVYLEYENTRLYAEVVQFVEARRLCWVRPIALVTRQASEDFIDWIAYDRLLLEDLRQGSDLMCPAILFREALDTEVFPLLAKLYRLDANSDTKLKSSTAHQQLHQFVRQIWKAHPEAFSNEH